MNPGEDTNFPSIAPTFTLPFPAGLLPALGAWFSSQLSISVIYLTSF